MGPKMREGKRDAPAVLYADDGDFVSNGPPGAFRWTGLYGVDEGGPYGMNFKCPCGCGAVHGAGFDNRPADWLAKDRPRPMWHWNGDKEKPTLTPSLGLHRSHDGRTIGVDGYHWHGHLKAGVFEEC
jgi:hypothetical protein